MKQTTPIHRSTRADHRAWWLLLVALILTAVVYWPGLSGGFLFDDYPNIVDNHGVQPQDAHFTSLVGAALSSPASEFKRPLASLSFAVNYLITGLDPYWMKLTNLVLHLLNGLLVFLLTRILLQCVRLSSTTDTHSQTMESATERSAGVTAALVSAGWMLLPINLTGVLYVVQRMESMANLFVLLGLLGYVAGRKRMLGLNQPANAHADSRSWRSPRCFLICTLSITAPTVVGILAKETAVMLPLYALLVEWAIFGFRPSPHVSTHRASPSDRRPPRHDRRVVFLFLFALVVPMTVGVAWLLPGVLRAENWASRDFTLGTRLLSEARIIVDYIVWTLLPTPDALSFYHDDFQISTGLLKPWTTLASIVALAALLALAIWLRRRQPLAALGIALFLGCQLLTGTILPLELIYEHRNYFASFGLLLTIIPWLAAPSSAKKRAADVMNTDAAGNENHAGMIASKAASVTAAGLPMALPRYALLAGLLLCWTALTALTAYAWGNPLRLAEDLASRAPQSPRAEYELGRTYIIYSHYDPSSPFTALAYPPLERAAKLPDSSILPEQALIFMNARMHLPLKEAWWDSMATKLKARKPGVQDESSLAALTQCAREQRCALPEQRMIQIFLAALAHPKPSARLLATYGDYAWNVLNDHALGLRMTKEAVSAQPIEPAYQITLIRMLAAQGEKAEAEAAIKKLETLNIGGRLDNSLSGLRALPGLQ
ncbi:MAG: hypothetical protein WA961_12955 [Rhodanobacter sp.]